MTKGKSSNRVLVSKEPIYGWGNGSQQSCSDNNGCPSHEDPHLWIDSKGGFHLLTHDQNDPKAQAGFTHVNKIFLNCPKRDSH